MTVSTSETIYVKEKQVSCDGGGGALGHPRIYMTLGKDGRAECSYCSRLFILEGSISDNK